MGEMWFGMSNAKDLFRRGSEWAGVQEDLMAV